MTVPAVDRFAGAPSPPYDAVVFSSLRNGQDAAGYDEAAAPMMALAATQPGYLGTGSASDAGGVGITVSDWRDEAAILAWKAQAGHAATRARGRRDGYTRDIIRDIIRVAKVERAHDWMAPPP